MNDMFWFTIFVFITSLGFAAVLLEHKAREARKEARKEAAAAGSDLPAPQYLDLEWSGGGPASDFAQMVLTAHLDVRALDDAVLTGTPAEMVHALHLASDSVHAMHNYLLQERERK